MTEKKKKKRGWQPGDDPRDMEIVQPVVKLSTEAYREQVQSYHPDQVADKKAKSEHKTETKTQAEEQVAQQEQTQQETVSCQEVQEQPKMEAASTPEERAEPQAEATNKPETQAQPQAKPYSVPAPNVQTAPSNEVDPSVVLYEKGCCAAAWDDIRNSKGWFGKVCLMALIEFVPILNWVNQGFALRWSRQLSLGKVESMPKKLFCKRAFANGAMTFLVSLVVGIVVAVGALILGCVPIIGSLAGLCLAIFVQMIMNFCYVRMAIFDELGEGFAINKGFDCLKLDFGKAFCIEFMPGLIFGIIIFCICMIIGVLFLFVNGFSIYADILSIISQYSSFRSFEYAMQYDTYLQMQIVAIIIRSFAICIPWLIVTGYLVNIFSMLCMLVKMRGAGHFVARYCSCWQREPKFNVVLQCEEE